ncbi:MAG: aspartate/glutamate racemase family protein, partial [Alphaproteobacteria bacterium]|nr:aspartate/glutamate racemase family protein [Alphaproteobacteria bacterium]
GDPGVLAAREAARGPVIGIAEAAMRVACMIATRFSVVTTLARTKIIAEHLVIQNGFQHQCAKIRATDIAVLSLEQSGDRTRQAIIEESHVAVAEDEVGAIVLGCAGMADLVEEVSSAIGVPVVEGVAAAVKLAEGIVALGLGTSKHGDLAYPLHKPYTGTLSYLSPMAAASEPGSGAA